MSVCRTGHVLAPNEVFSAHTHVQVKMFDTGTQGEMKSLDKII